MQTAGLRPADGQGKPCPYGTRDILPVRKRRFMARSQAPAWERIPGGSASQAARHNFAICPGRARTTDVPRLEPGNEMARGIPNHILKTGGSLFRIPMAEFRPWLYLRRQDSQKGSQGAVLCSYLPLAARLEAFRGLIFRAFSAT